MPVNAAIRLNPQSAVRNVQNRFRRSELEPRAPRNDLKIDPRSSRGVHSAQRFAQNPTPPTKAGIQGICSRE
eukprot:4144793-Alexandrium_andersonii.AAC.1